MFPTWGLIITRWKVALSLKQGFFSLALIFHQTKMSFLEGRRLITSELLEDRLSWTWIFLTSFSKPESFSRFISLTRLEKQIVSKKTCFYYTISYAPPLVYTSIPWAQYSSKHIHPLQIL
jgi:hypothetical protein